MLPIGQPVVRKSPPEMQPSGLEELYRAFFVRLVRRATWRYGLSKDDAREIVHDAFLLALTKLDAKGNPRAWIYGVVDRLAANWRNKALRRSHLMQKWGSTGCSESSYETEHRSECEGDES